MDKLLTKEVIRFLREKEFINIATADFMGRPNVAPKFLLNIKGDSLYLIDYVVGQTYQNLKINPKVSISTMNVDTLVGYQINGMAEIIEKGDEYQRLLKVMNQKQIKFSTKRVIEGVKLQRRHNDFEVTLPEEAVIFRIKVLEIVEIGSSGQLERKKI